MAVAETVVLGVDIFGVYIDTGIVCKEAELGRVEGYRIGSGCFLSFPVVDDGICFAEEFFAFDARIALSMESVVVEIQDISRELGSIGDTELRSKDSN